MNRSAFPTIGVFACAAAAWLGWHTGLPSSSVTPRAVSKVPAPTPAPASNVDYAPVAGPDFDARKGRTLAEILATIDRLRLDPVAQATVDDSISGELFALLHSLTAAEIPGVLAHLAALPPPAPDKVLAAVLGRWARFDGAAAMKWAGKLTASRQDTVRGDILSGWAHTDPRAAWEWYKAAWDAAPEPRYRLEQDFPLLIHAWALRDAKAALEACLTEGKHGTFDAWSGFASLAAMPERREEVMKLIAGIGDEKARQAASRSALGRWSASAPADAAAWVDANLPHADGNILWAVAERFGRANPRANADWLLKRTPPDKRDEAYNLCLYQWAEHKPDEAAAWLESAGVTDQSAQIIAERYARTDLDRAVSWAQRVSVAKRPEAVASSIAAANSHGRSGGGSIAGPGESSGTKPGKVSPDVSKYAAAAGVSAEELAKLVEKVQRQRGSRL